VFIVFLDVLALIGGLKCFASMVFGSLGSSLSSKLFLKDSINSLFLMKNENKQVDLQKSQKNLVAPNQVP
jgi:hypothetical protein